MSHPDHPLAALAYGLEVALSLAGLVLLWRLALSPAAKSRRAPAALAPWPGTASDLLLFLLLAFCGTLLLTAIVHIVLRQATLGSEARLLLAAATFQFGLLAGIAAFQLGFARGLGSRPRAPSRAISSGAAAMLIAVPLVYGIAAAWQGLLALAGFPVETEASVQNFLDLHSPLLRAAYIAIATLVAPVTEELVFRAGLFRYLSGRTPRWVALLLPSMLFAGLHQSLAAFAGLTLLGVIFSLAYERTGRIGTSIVAHALFNLNTVLLVMLGVNA